VELVVAEVAVQAVQVQFHFRKEAHLLVQVRQVLLRTLVVVRLYLRFQAQT
jgi:hypothetical protein